MLEKVLAFDIWGDYAHFRKIYTTGSPLTYSFPPRTAISGLIGAIVGFDKEDYFRHFLLKDAKIGCKIIDPIKKVRIGENLINTKLAVKMHLIKNRNQVRIEFVKDPRYRIYFTHSDEVLYNNVRSFLINHQSVYTPCLGLSQLICNFRFVGEFGLRKSDEGLQTIDSVVPGKCIINTEIEEKKEYFSEILPNEMNECRVVTNYSEILFERNGKEIKAEARDLWEINNNGKRIAFF